MLEDNVNDDDDDEEEEEEEDVEEDEDVEEEEENDVEDETYLIQGYTTLKWTPRHLSCSSDEVLRNKPTEACSYHWPELGSDGFKPNPSIHINSKTKESIARRFQEFTHCHGYACTCQVMARLPGGTYQSHTRLAW